MLGEQEFDKIIYDEEGNIIDIIEVEEDQGEIPDYSDSYYESEGARYINTQTSIESDIMKKKEEYDTTLLELINLLQKGVNEKKLSSDDRYSIKDLMDKTAANYSELKNMLTVEEERTIREQIQDIKENMIPATSDAILDILTEGGTKSWLYKDNDDNVLIDGLSIPELTILINKLNLIALGDGEESQFQINPDFINMVVEKTGGGEGIKSVSTKYYLSTSTTELVGGEWLDILPSIDEQQGKYLWYKLITTYLNSDKEPQETQPICISSRDGTTTYTWIRYADDSNGNGISNLPNNKAYIGFAYNKDTPIESDIPGDYTWSLIKGEKGDTGVPGTPGIDGTTTYTWIKYSDNPDGTDMYDLPKSTTEYIGIATNKTIENESDNKTDYKWSKFKGDQGVQGEQGVPGNDGRGVESVAIEYAKNQSTTTAPTSGWSTAMPSYQEGYYLWYRTRIKYTDNANYVYSTPICDESWKLNQQVYTQYKQLSDKFTWLVKGGDSQSTMTLTDKMYELISKNITLTADRINLNGYISANGGNFSIDEQGNIEANDLNVNGTLTCKDMNVTTIISPKAPEGMESNIDIQIASGDTITAHLDELPLNLNGYSVNIYLDADTSENVELRRHYAGMINIFLCGYNIKGTIRSSFNNAIYSIYGGETTSDTTNIGSIMPYTAYKSGSYYYSTFFVNSPNIVIKNIKIYGGKTNTSYTVGIGGTRKSKIEADNITFINCKHNARTYSLAELYCGKSYGKANGIGWYAGTGSLISFGANDQAGGSPATSTNNNGRILAEGTTFNGTAQQGTNDNDNDPVTTRIATYKPTSGGTYRYTLYNNWRNDNVVRQGKWGTTSGNCAGAWLYGSQFEEVVGKNITKVEISVSRVEGTGNSASCSHSFQAHTHTTRPSGAPAFTTCNKSISLAWGESGVITITDSTILDGIKAGTFKGFGIKSAFDEAHYSALSNGTVKIYYTE